jgi:hypothetical protein
MEHTALIALTTIPGPEPQKAAMSATDIAAIHDRTYTPSMMLSPPKNLPLLPTAQHSISGCMPRQACRWSIVVEANPLFV